MRKNRKCKDIKIQQNKEQHKKITKWKKEKKRLNIINQNEQQRNRDI